MKKLVCAMLMAAAAIAAFADGDDNVVVLVTTAGPDTYKGGETVLDGECYALVWSSDGVFDGFTAAGEPVDKNDRIVNVGAVAKNGHCRAAFEISATLVDSLKNGVYAIYLLDTRVKEGESVVPRGLVNGKLAVLNGYGEVSEGVTVSAGVAVANETQDGEGGGKHVGTVAAPSPNVQQPKIKKIVPEEGGMAIYVENLKGYMRVQTGKDLSLSDGVTPAVQTGGSDDTVKIVVPKEGDSGFYKVIRN